MSIIGVRELSRQTREVVERLEVTGEPAIITRQGQPVAALIAVDGDRLEDLVLSAAPEFVDSTREADAALAAGRTRPMSEVLAGMAATAVPSPTTELSAAADPAQLVSDYADLVARFSAETARKEMPEEAGPAQIEELQSISADLFRELASSMLMDVTERVRLATENAVLAGRQRGGFGASLELLQGVKTAQRLTHGPYRQGQPLIGPAASAALRDVASSDA